MLSSIIANAATLLAIFTSAAAMPTSSPFVGTITAPTPDAAVLSGDALAFTYQPLNWCEQDYTEFKVALVPYEPTFANVTDSKGTLQNALLEFGIFTVANFPCK